MEDDELEDAKDAIRAQNLDPDDFSFSHRDTLKAGPGIFPIRGKVTVHNRKNGATKIYATGHGTSWPAAFGDDLELGVFR